MQHALASPYTMFLVLLSFIIALLTSYTSLKLAKKISVSKAWHQKLWILCCSVAMGVGIWSMHFTALLAYPLPDGIPFSIHAVLTSIVIAIIGAFIGFFVTFRSKKQVANIVIAGTFMGMAISVMQFIGISSMSDVKVLYSPLLFILSIIIAIIASIKALYVSFHHNQSILLNGLIIGAAFTGMHHIGMAAAIISKSNSIAVTNLITINLSNYILAMYIAFATLVILTASFIMLLLSDQRIAQRIWLKASVLDSSIDSIMMFNHRGWIVEFNPAAEATFGYTRKDALGRTLFDFLFTFDQDGQGAAALFRLFSQKDDALIGKRVKMMAYRSDRSGFPAEVTITGNLIAGNHLYTATIRDLTERQQPEQNKEP
ncbi:MHYT domain-containing protein [Paenibacillus sp. SI8]|uniref:MHYT domain-containing protein n=1 Tax=unclassified Paenibacillus TaxID=185978 RepID=UPI0034661A42